MKSRMKRTWLNRMLEAGGRNRRSDDGRKFGFEILERRCLLSVSAGVAMVPIDLLDDLAQTSHISRVDAPRPATTRDAAPAEAADKTVSVTVSDELVELFAGPLRGKIGSDLYLLQKEYEAHKADPEAGPFDPNRPGLVTVGDEVVVTIVFDSLLSQEVDLAASARMHAQELEKLGFTVQHAFGPSVTGSVRPDLLDDVASLEGVLSLRATYRSTRTGTVTPQGDQTQRSDVARSTYAVAGSGVQVGMISASTANATVAFAFSDDDTASPDRLSTFLDVEAFDVNLHGVREDPDLLYEAIAWEAANARSDVLSSDFAVHDTPNDIASRIDLLVLSGSWESSVY